MDFCSGPNVFLFGFKLSHVYVALLFEALFTLCAAAVYCT